MATYKILSSLGDRSSVAWYRQFVPHLRMRDELLKYDIQIDATINLKYDPNAYDCYVFGRIPTNDDIFIIIDQLYRAGKKIIWDLDDEIWTIPDENKYKEHYNELHLKWLYYYLGMATRVTASTNNLANSIIKRFGFDSRKVCVLENLVSKDDYEFFYQNEKNFYSNPLKIIYSGSDSHSGDMERLLELYSYFGSDPNIMFIFYGFMPGEFVAETPRKIMHIGWSPNRKYYEGMMSFLSPHIALMPLADNSFNRCKSSIKHFEMAMSQCVCVASNIPPYSDTIKHIEDGFLCKNSNDWISSCYELSEDRDKIMEMALLSRNNVIQDYSWDTDNRRRRDWLEFFKAIPDM